LFPPVGSRGYWGENNFLAVATWGYWDEGGVQESVGFPLYVNPSEEYLLSVGAHISVDGTLGISDDLRVHMESGQVWDLAVVDSSSLTFNVVGPPAISAVVTSLEVDGAVDTAEAKSLTVVPDAPYEGSVAKQRTFELEMKTSEDNEVSR
jgi:hypothetical protein